MPGAGQNTADGDPAEAGLLCDAGTSPAFATQDFNLCNQLRRGGLTQPPRTRAAVLETIHALLPIAPDLLGSGLILAL